MTLETLIASLEDAKFDVFLHEAPDNTDCPYVVVEELYHPNFSADNKTFFKTTRCILRLVESEVHDWELIEQMENTLDSLELFYSSEDNSVPSEHVCETLYAISFFGGMKDG